jgi:hypothetical protein
LNARELTARTVDAMQDDSLAIGVDELVILHVKLRSRADALRATGGFGVTVARCPASRRDDSAT